MTVATESAYTCNNQFDFSYVKQQKHQTLYVLQKQSAYSIYVGFFFNLFIFYVVNVVTEP